MISPEHVARIFNPTFTSSKCMAHLQFGILTRSAVQMQKQGHKHAQNAGLPDAQVEAVRRRKQRHRLLGDMEQADHKYTTIEVEFKEHAMGTYIFVGINK